MVGPIRSPGILLQFLAPPRVTKQNTCEPRAVPSHQQSLVDSEDPSSQPRRRRPNTPASWPLLLSAHILPLPSPSNDGDRAGRTRDSCHCQADGRDRLEDAPEEATLPPQGHCPSWLSPSGGGSPGAGDHLCITRNDQYWFVKTWK